MEQIDLGVWKHLGVWKCGQTQSFVFDILLEI